MGEIGVGFLNRNKVNEKIMTIIFALALLGALITVIFLDVPHGDFGDSFAQGEINSKIIMEQGHIDDPAIPEGLLILGAGQPAILNFEVYNLDPDNDIDTIEVVIPDSDIETGSYEWYRSDGDHEWTHDLISTDTISFEAQDDFLGSEGGEVPYYDTAGNIDDALDFIEDYNDGDNPVYDLSEGITLSVSFNTTDEPGFKMGDDSINLKVGDLQTESPGAPLTAFDPFPYPYITADNEDSFLIIVLKTPSCHLEVEYGGQLLFSPTRSGDFMTSQFGFEYITDSGATVAALMDPGDIPVKSLVSAKEDGATGKFTLDMYEVMITDIETGTIEKTTIVSDYQDDIPEDMGEVVDNDLDNDGVFNNDDDDMDGDGIPNPEDNFPKIHNLLPVVTGKTQNLTVLESDVFSLMVVADDPESEDLTYTWKNDKDPEWTESSSMLDLTGFDPGVYIFTVEIADEMGNTRTESIKVTILDNLPPVIHSVDSSEAEITVGDDLTLSVNASDPENKTITYTWTHDSDPEWEKTGNPITVLDLEEGDYIFTVTVDDEWSNTTGTVRITVNEEEEGLPWLPIIIAVIVVLIIIVLILVLVLRKKKTGEDTEMNNYGQEEYDTDHGGVDMSPEAQYEGFYDPNDKDMAVGSYTPDAPLEFYPAEPTDVIREESHEGAQVMEYPDEITQNVLPGDQMETPSIAEPEPVENLPSATMGETAQDVGEEVSVESQNIPQVPSMPPPPPPVSGVNTNLDNEDMDQH